MGFRKGVTVKRVYRRRPWFSPFAWCGKCVDPRTNQYGYCARCWLSLSDAERNERTESRELAPATSIIVSIWSILTTAAVIWLVWKSL